MFCVTCLREYLKTKIMEGLITETHIICPMLKCNHPINYFLIKEILPAGLFEKFDDLLSTHSFQNPQKNDKTGEFMISCPNCNIDCIIDSQLSYFKCLNCRESFCASKKCLKNWKNHAGKPCESLRRNRKDFEEEKFNEYVKNNNLKFCPVCNAVIEKTKNCNYVQCNSIKCQKKTIFCYICGELLHTKDLATHYLNNSPFSKCMKPLSNNKNDISSFIKEKEKVGSFESGYEKSPKRKSTL